MLPNAKTKQSATIMPIKLELEEQPTIPSDKLISSAPLAKPESFSDLLADDLDDILPQTQHSNSSLYLNLNPNLFIDDLNTSNMYYDDSISYKLETTNSIHKLHQNDTLIQSQSRSVHVKEDDELKSNLAWWPYTLDTSSYPATQNNSLNMAHHKASSPPIEIKKCVRNRIQIVIEPNIQSPPDSAAPNRRMSTSTPRTESTRDWMIGQPGCIASPPLSNRKHISSQYLNNLHPQNTECKPIDYDAYEYDYDESDVQVNSSNSFFLNSYSLNVSSFMMNNEKKKIDKQTTYDRPKMSASFDCSSNRMPNNLLLDTPIRLKPKASKSLAEANRTSTTLIKSHLRLTDSLRFNNHASSMSLGFSNQFRFIDELDRSHFDNKKNTAAAAAVNKINSTWLKASSSTDNRFRADQNEYDFNNESLIANYESIEKLAILKPQSKDYILCFDTSSIDNSNNNNNSAANGSESSVSVGLNSSSHECKNKDELKLMSDSFNSSSNESSSYYMYNNSSNGEHNHERGDTSASPKGNNKELEENKNDEDNTFKSVLDSCDSGVDTARTLSPYVFNNFVLTKNNDQDEA